MEFVGFLSAILLAVCGVPQAWKSWRTKSSVGVDLTFLLLWLVGELMLLLYASNKQLAPLMLNASLNIFVIGIILRYKKM